MKITKKQFIKACQDYMDPDINGNKHHQVILAFLQKNEGKDMNGHLWRRLPEGYTVRHRYGNTSIISPDGTDHLVKYDSSEPECNPKDFLRFDSCHSNDTVNNRIRQIREVMDNPERLSQAVKFFNTIGKHYDALLKLMNNDLQKNGLDSFHFPPFYNVVQKVADYNKIRDFY